MKHQFADLLSRKMECHGRSVYLDQVLRGLNEAQKLAVTSSPKGQLQIVAGPGTGKIILLIKIGPRFTNSL